MKNYLMALTTLTVLMIARNSSACTAFQARTKTHKIVGQSYDWLLFHGHVFAFAQPRAVCRVGENLKGSDHPLEWISRFASLTITQFGKGLPISGMNEKGLTVVVLQLDETTYNTQDKHLPYLNEAQLAQYLLDMSQNTDDAIASLAGLRVEMAFIGLHYFVSDKDGKAAVIEYVDGELKVFRDEDLPVEAITNHPYSETDAQEPGIFRTSQNRFRQVAKQLRNWGERSTVEKVLDSVRLQGVTYDAPLYATQFNAIYIPSDMLASFRTRMQPDTKFIDVEKLLQTKEVLMLDLNDPKSGDVTAEFARYAPESNRKLIDQNRWLMNQKTRDAAATLGQRETP